MLPGISKFGSLINVDEFLRQNALPANKFPIIAPVKATRSVVKILIDWLFSAWIRFISTITGDRKEDVG